jgi:prepilin-type N-terminal cleavage/methylation domain-containing protein
MLEGSSSVKKRNAFTLIELLVVVAVIAILVSVLLPALNGARKEGQSLSALSNARSAHTATEAYVANGGFSFGGSSTGVGQYPPAYLYAIGQTADGKADPRSVKEEFQLDSHPSPGSGYLNWSYLFFDGDFVREDAFTSPLVLNGGAPRTNPGDDDADWEADQVNGAGQSAASGVEDLQAPRLAFAPNGLIIGRNKFSDNLRTRRKSRLVKTSEVRQPDSTVLFSEFAERDGWKSVMVGGGGGFESKSHRPITPVTAFGGDDFNEPVGTGVERYFYWDPETLREWDEIGAGAIERGSDVVGRHHPGERTVFVHVDGSGIRDTLEESIRDFRWGRRYYSITGDSDIDDDEFRQ